MDLANVDGRVSRSPPDHRHNTPECLQRAVICLCFLVAGRVLNGGVRSTVCVCVLWTIVTCENNEHVFTTPRHGHAQSTQ